MWTFEVLSVKVFVSTTAGGKQVLSVQGDAPLPVRALPLV